ncbi:MAG: OmpA family protein [Candidatus Marinimicrobia bacterium]|jgi:chemotaxis protein MotB|nr:OmpA family protein [Candidatus Neomarinimicrobiota bacterium]MBT3629931.1 OmpA family protein [Candidatus Neomarinimicrobiota bacterium]MBT3825352.1 OmpA family protein [Candidatus Neomarinimicrobiota bacterium]MBT4132679.1 OmpA family protein [Candidatus Neomarinimicrobiota bacterium]MBT4296528.1 OmpA family protein [Candidatus Neomarinimicrobiota bacterium]
MAKRSDRMAKIVGNARSSWVLSYGDTVTLLICFFIMMITVRAGQINKVHAWVNDRLDEAATEVQEAMDAAGIQEISVSRNSKGVQITLNDPRLFEVASAQPRSTHIYQLDEVATSIQNLHIFNLLDTEHAGFLRELQSSGLQWLVEIRIEGHTDNMPLTRNALYRDNWELSAARAQSIMIQLQENTALPASIFAIGGFGEFQPIGDNTTQAGREINRRVEIFIGASLVQSL